MPTCVIWDNWICLCCILFTVTPSTPIIHPSKNYYYSSKKLSTRLDSPIHDHCCCIVKHPTALSVIILDKLPSSPSTYYLHHQPQGTQLCHSMISVHTIDLINPLLQWSSKPLDYEAWRCAVCLILWLYHRIVRIACSDSQFVLIIMCSPLFDGNDPELLL